MNTIKIVHVIGTRPQFIKFALIYRQLLEDTAVKQAVIHTGQHFDRNMSDIFIKELGILKPDYFLNVNSLDYSAMIGKMFEKIERVLIKEKPDFVLVYGDTNSTLAGALAAKKLNIKIAHIESGLRSFNMQMPEEINRVLTDRISDILFCPTNAAVNNLKKERLNQTSCKIIKSGDVMQDAAKFYGDFAKRPPFDLPKEFVLTTVHRAENADNPENLKKIFTALNRIAKEIDIILPIHPRTKKAIVKTKMKANFTLVEPVGYLEMIYLLKNCSLVMTDSGGLQKEAFFFQKPCVTLREETEWLELVEGGFNLLAGSNPAKIYKCYKTMRNKKFDFKKNLYGKGKASKHIVKELLN
jgi:UDP-GlcNAc3NAcA epimerase